MPIECEAKLRVDGFDTIRNRLQALGAVDEGECLERNWILDDSEESLRRRNVLLRVRTMGGTEGILTVKTQTSGGEFKNRREIETMTDSAADLIVQLSAAGLSVVRIYEKIRQTWLWRDCVVSLDKCPEIGCFVEIEGRPDRIRETASELSLDPAAHIDDSYLALWMKHLAALGQKPRDMVFAHGALERYADK